MKKRILILLLLVAATAFGYWKWQQHQRAGQGELVLYGNVDIREVNLGFRVSGRILELKKDEGDAVAAGEVLARLDREPFQRAVEQAGAVLAAAEAKLTMMESGYRKEDKAQASAQLAEREATAANARKNADRQAELVKTRAASQRDFDDAQARLLEAEARINSARASVALLDAGFRPEEIAQVRADRDQARAALETARIQLADTELKSPSAGVVTTRARETGAIVQSGATVLTVSLEDPVWVRAYIDESHLGSVHPGSDLLVFTDSRPGRPYHGKVGFISPRSEFTPKSVETAELRTSLVYRLRIVISDPDPALRQGMPTTVKFPDK